MERRGLLLSVWGALGAAGLGILFAALTGSQAVLLDGVFSLIGFAVALVSMKVAVLARRPGDEHYHFGYAAYEPMLNFFKGLLMAAVSLVAAVVAVDAILRGGRTINGGMAVVYALLAAAGCLLIWAAQRGAARKTESPLLEVDAKNWLLDGLISGAVAVAFLVVVLLEGSALAHLAPYADPAVLLLLVLLSIPVPLKIIARNWNQLLGRAPEPAIQREVRRRVEAGLAGVEDVAPDLRMLETGRLLYLQVTVLVGSNSGLDRLEDLDGVRDRIRDSVLRETVGVEVDVIFTRGGDRTSTI
jgi:cation diffusion facilitator family transporter